MAYDAGLEERIDEVIATWELALPKKKMFSGIGYFLNGNMVFGIRKNELIVRVNEPEGKGLLRRAGVRPFQMGNRAAMKNWYLAGGEAIAEDAKLAELLELSREFVSALPPKQ